MHPLITEMLARERRRELYAEADQWRLARPCPPSLTRALGDLARAPTSTPVRPRHPRGGHAGRIGPRGPATRIIVVRSGHAMGVVPRRVDARSIHPCPTGVASPRSAVADERPIGPWLAHATKGTRPVALLVLLIALVLVEVAVWRWEADSRQPDPRDRFWWPHG